MSNQNFSQEGKHHIAPKPEQKAPQQADIPGAESPAEKVQHIQRKLGNRAVQRVLAQRSGEGGGSSVDEETEQRINSQRGGGQPLDVGVQQQMQNAIGYDFSGVRVHTSNEASNLSQSLQAKAFTTGKDVFFNEGQYQPNTSSGQELIAHELTHVAQQGTGQVASSGSSMTVNEPNDSYEQQADATARQALSSPAATGQPATAQRQEVPDDELQEKPLDSAVQRQEEPEDDENALAQSKPLDAALQRQDLEEEDGKLQTSPLHRQEVDDDEQVA